jgi:hypothetical protein
LLFRQAGNAQRPRNSATRLHPKISNAVGSICNSCNSLWTYSAASAIRAEIEKYARIVEATGIRLDQ